MRTTPLALALAALSPLLQAHEVGLIAGKLVGKAQVADAAFFGQPKGGYDALSPTGMGLRLGYSLLDLKVAELGLTGTYLAQGEADVKLDGRATGLKYKAGYLALGAQVDWKFLVNLNVGLDIRKETLELGNEKVDQTRPWIRAGVGFSLPTPILSPFARLELAVPTVKEERRGTQGEMVKALAPQFQVSAYAGIRF